jgi:hypothetical protein
MSHSTIVGGSTASRVINCLAALRLLPRCRPARQALMLMKAHSYMKSWPSYSTTGLQNLMTS